MSKPRLLDLFSGAGGGAVGYAQGGFEGVGVDNGPQKNYPFEFHLADALMFPLDGFDVIHASPVCKAYTQFNLSPKENYEKLIPDVIDRLRRSGKIFVVENVVGAKHELPGALWLCGSMFGLKVWRHRLFESNILLFAPGPCQHTYRPISVHGHHGWDHSQIVKTRKGGNRYRLCSPEESKAAMGIDWMQRDELAEAIPPAYTQWIGEQLMQVISTESAGVA